LSQSGNLKGSFLHQWWLERTLTSKMLLLMLLVFSLAWLVIDHIQSERIWHLQQKHQRTLLVQEGMENRVRLDDFTRSINHASKLMIHLEGFKLYLNKMEQAGWSSQESITVVEHEQRPSWLPRKFLIRGLANARYVLLMDTELRVREVFQNGPTPLQPEVMEEIPDYVSPDGEIYLAVIEDMPHMVVPGILRDENQNPRVFLVFLVPLDEPFLFFFQQKAAGKSIVAFFDRESSTVVSSSRPELVPRGTKQKDLEKKFLVVMDRFLDFGFSADLEMEFAVLTPWHEVEEVSRQMLASERPLRIVTAAILILVILLILLWISYQLRRFSNQMIEFSQQQLGIHSPIDRKGDQLTLIQEQFFFMGQEIVQMRSEEKKRSEDLSVANQELETHRHHLFKLVDKRTEDLKQTTCLSGCRRRL
jgi:hypothetical protein